jgi:hypothetical protein
MSSFYSDPYRKVSEPTEADFIRGMADSSVKSNGGANIMLALAAGLLMSRAVRRRK